MPQSNLSDEYKVLIEENFGCTKILAEGDSWLAYPRQFLFYGAEANITDHLAYHDDLAIFNTASNGDEAVAMLSGEQKFSLIKSLMEFEFDYLLFSGGGNDVVGRYDFDFFIRNKEDGFDWEDCIRKDRVGLKIDQIDSAYRTLCELTTEYSSNPNITIITHTYERLTPIDEGFALFDLIPLGKAWLHPFMVKKNIADPDDQRRIVGFILNEFKNALFGVANDYGVGRVYETERDTNRALFNVVDTWDTVLAGEWRNEIHPTSDGFEKVAQKIYDEQIAE